MRRRRLLFLNVVLAVVALLVTTTGAALAYQPPLVVLYKIQAAGTPVPGGFVTYQIHLQLAAPVLNVKLTDTLRGKIDKVGPASTTCPNGITEVLQGNFTEREDWGFYLGNFATPVSCDVFVSAQVRSTAKVGSTVYNDVALSTSTGWKGSATAATGIVAP